MSFHEKIAEEALIACQRACCLCHKFSGICMELHHIKPISKGGDDTLENCIPLCLNCHALVGHYNEKHPKGRKYSENELKKYRDNWYVQVIELNKIDKREEEIIKTIQQNIRGNNNIVASGDVKITTEKIIKKTIVSTDPGGKHITNETARKIKELVDQFIELNEDAGKNPSEAAKKIWSKLKKEFNVTTYKEIGIERSKEAIDWLYAQISMMRPKVRRPNPEKWRKTYYAPIYAKSKELGITKEKLYELAKERIPLKKSISSLKDLTQRDLVKLNNIISYEYKKKK